MHRDVLPVYPPQIERQGHSPCCHVQGMYAKNRLLSLQGHPEFNGNVAEELLDLSRGTVFTDETYHNGKFRVHNPHDGVTIAAEFLRFLLED